MSKSYGTHLNDERLEKYSMGSLPENEIELLEDHLLACGECQAAVESDYRLRRMIELGRSDASAHAVAGGARFELTPRKGNGMTDVQHTPNAHEASHEAAHAAVKDHWLSHFVDALHAAHKANPHGIDFATAEHLLKTEKQHFDADMETALRMFHLYPHLFHAGSAASGSAA